jgi:hypothetical protein
MKKISLLLVVIALASCSTDNTSTEVKTDSTGIAKVDSSTIQPTVVTPMCADFNNVPDFVAPYVDSIGTKGIALTKENFKKYNFSKAEKYIDGEKYSLIAKMAKGKNILMILSRDSDNEIVHWLVSVSADSCKLTDHKESAFGDFVESMSAGKAEINDNEIKIIQTNYNYNDSVPKSTVKTKVYTLTDEGKFEKVK